MSLEDKFCYVIVKKFDSVGCVGVKIKGDSAIGLSELLDAELDVKTTQVVLLNNPEMYGEYKPYDIKSNLKEFLDTVLN